MNTIKNLTLLLVSSGQKTNYETLNKMLRRIHKNGRPVQLDALRKRRQIRSSNAAHTQIKHNHRVNNQTQSPGQFLPFLRERY